MTHPRPYNLYERKTQHMKTDLLWKIDEGGKVNLKGYDPGYTGTSKKHDGTDQELEELRQELYQLQETMYAAQQHSLLMVLQGMDTSGKDGTISHIFSGINPQGCTVHSFKQPSAEELAHDFLWRIHNATPSKGMMGIFNRSQYEDVLIVRVHKLVADEVWKQRYQQINHFEKTLTQNNTIVLKFFLHISYEEQEQRLRARVQDQEKSWKISAGDWTERTYWKDYQHAYEDALNNCSTKEAPWYIVPANHKWYRNLAIAHTLVATLRPYKEQWQKQLEARGQQELEKLKQMNIVAQ
jgi:PPK2 family polyphosphate:nucleotide phosphotransferase